MVPEKGGTTKKCENKNLAEFFISMQISEMHETERVKKMPFCHHMRLNPDISITELNYLKINHKERTGNMLGKE